MNETTTNGHHQDINSEESLYREKKPTARRKKRNSRFAEAVLRKKPLFDPSMFFLKVFVKYGSRLSNSTDTASRMIIERLLLSVQIIKPGKANFLQRTAKMNLPKERISAFLVWFYTSFYKPLRNFAIEYCSVAPACYSCVYLCPFLSIRVCLGCES